MHIMLGLTQRRLTFTQETGTKTALKLLRPQHCLGCQLSLACVVIWQLGLVEEEPVPTEIGPQLHPFQPSALSSY